MRYLFVAIIIFLGVSVYNPTRSPPQMAICHPTEQQIDRFEMANKISTRFKVSQQLTKQVVGYAQKYERDSFPKAKDIIAIIGIESSFKPAAVSKLARDPAVGLTQIRPVVWRHKYSRTSLNDPENQVKYGAEILSHYFDVLGSREAAVEAYNIGITAYKKGRTNPRYVAKYKKELAQY